MAAPPPTFGIDILWPCLALWVGASHGDLLARRLHPVSHGCNRDSRGWDPVTVRFGEDTSTADWGPLIHISA
ncbi:hypothetical protein NDU88_005837 [Pleurodeles waltl]|uniref:Secreted protein n=1 Tax=Pleurodeles waltl TaxID=8319 RepID=A0AAV7ME33_PLEWA|nr:hypothetical protein NDU88_005837 [Pleurodeles waltl]